MASGESQDFQLAGADLGAVGTGSHADGTLEVGRRIQDPGPGEERTQIRGFRPDGIYTAATDAALKHDVKMTKAYAFNMSRKQWDPSRLVSNASGWVDEDVGDVLDHHTYPEPGEPESSAKRAAVIDEYGGLRLNLKGHMWVDSGWGYRTFDDAESLNERYEEITGLLLQRVQDPGISAGVYTQVSDVEVENNGLMTYDREITKVKPEVSARVRKGLLPPRKTSWTDQFVGTGAVELQGVSEKGRIVYKSKDKVEELPDFAKLKAAKATVAERVNLKPRPREEHFGLVFQGFLNAPTTGVYLIRVASDDGALVLIDGQPVCGEDGIHRMEGTMGTAALEAGNHAITVRYFHGDGDRGLRLDWQVPGAQFKEIPGRALTHAEE